jgi:hypothetical protein
MFFLILLSIGFFIFEINNKKKKDMGEEKEEIVYDKTTQLFKSIPFMSEFPFDDYEMTIEDLGLPLDQLGISPILIREIGNVDFMKRVDFYYAEGESSVSISLRKDDIDWLASEAHKIKKLDDLREKLDTALESMSLVDKIKNIKTCRKFLVNFDDPSLYEVDFNLTLSEFLELYEVSLESKVKLALQNLNAKSFIKFDFTENQYRAVSGFLNFQLHYIKIILGIIIAAKIY